MKDKVFWTMKNGQQIDVDQMDINHLRNTLKMILRNRQKAIVKRTAKFTLNGDIAQDFVDQQILAEMQEDCEDYYLPF